MGKLNKYGCKPCEDVCLEHDSPLITYGICEDSPEIKEFISERIKALTSELEAERKQKEEAIRLLDIFFGNCTYSETGNGFESEISRSEFNEVLDFKEEIIKASKPHTVSKGEK